MLLGECRCWSTEADEIDLRAGNSRPNRVSVACRRAPTAPLAGSVRRGNRPAHNACRCGPVLSLIFAVPAVSRSIAFPLVGRVCWRRIRFVPQVPLWLLSTACRKQHGIAFRRFPTADASSDGSACRARWATCRQTRAWPCARYPSLHSWSPSFESRLNEKPSRCVCLQPCTPGSFTNATGQTRCLPCSRGRFVNAPAKSSCSPCDAGKFAPQDQSPQWSVFVRFLLCCVAHRSVRVRIRVA